MKKLLCTALVAVFLTSCSDDNENILPSEGNFENGYLIINEGNFQSANSSLTHLSEDFSNVQDNIFKTINGRSIGDVAQSLTTTDKYVFVVVNNSNTIEVLDKKTMKSVKTITSNLFSPRFAVVKNNKLYVTNMNKAEVSVFSATTFDFITSISLNFAAENIVATNDYIYAANGFYSGGSLVEIINPNTDKNTEDISFNKSINGLTADISNVYVLDTNDTSSTITKINGATKTNVIDVPQTNARYAVVDNNTIYYTSGTGVYKLDTNLTSTTKLFDVPDNTYSTLYGFNVLNNVIFTSDANGFTDKGKVTLYKPNGETIKTFNAGIGPCGFYKL